MRRDYISTIKIIVVGNSYTGKTSFVNRWTRGHFSNSYKTTIMSEFGCKKISIDNCVYQVQLWDIAGMDRHASVAHLFLKDTSGIIVLSAVNDDDTLYDTLKWKEEIYNKVNEQNVHCPMILIQNKSDLIKEENMKEKENDIKNFSESNKFTNWFLTSAKTGKGVNEAMNYLIEMIVDEIKNKQRKVPVEEEDVIRCSTITESSYKEEDKKTKCC